MDANRNCSERRDGNRPLGAMRSNGRMAQSAGLQLERNVLLGWSGIRRLARPISRFQSGIRNPFSLDAASPSTFHRHRRMKTDMSVTTFILFVFIMGPDGRGAGTAVEIGGELHCEIVATGVLIKVPGAIAWCVPKDGFDR